MRSNFSNFFFNSIVFSSFLIFSSPLTNYSYAQENNQPEELANLSSNDLANLSIEELLNLEVSVASKSMEKTSEAPAIITTFTKNEIEKFAARNLLEVLEKLPNVYPISSYYARDNVLSIRGNLGAHYDNQVLILLNGRPMRDSQYGLDSPILLGFPIDTIERLEIIRGPGSVLYGTNAYSGVVNIITKKAEITEAKASIVYGSFNEVNVNVDLETKVNDVSLNGGIKFLKNDGWKFEAVDEKGKKDSINYNDFNYSGVFSASHENFSVNSFFGQVKHNHMGIYPIWVPERFKFDFIKGFTDIGYNHKFSDIWNTSFNLTYNGLYLDVNRVGDTSTSKALYGPGHELLFEVSNFINPIENLNVLVGGSANYSMGGHLEADKGVKAYSEWWWNTYTQLDYKPFDFLKLVAGGQLNKPAGVNFDFVPRLSAIFNVTPEFGGKVLYAQAFRSATEAENALDVTGTLRGNRDLLPEKISTIDAQLFYNADIYQMSATYFNSQQSNLITRKFLPDEGIATYINGGKIWSQGIELEGKLIPIPELYLIGSFVYQANIDEQGRKNVTFIPNIMGKLGISYSLLNQGLNISLFNNYTNAPEDVSIINPTRAMVNPVPTPVNLLTAKVTFDIKKIGENFNYYGLPNITASIYGMNLLDSQVYYAEFLRKNINSIPARPGRTIYFEIGYKL